MPSWAQNEKIWERAKKEVDRKKYPDDDAYYAVVTTVYKNMGGKIKKSGMALLKCASELQLLSKKLRKEGKLKMASDIERVSQTLEEQAFCE